MFENDDLQWITFLCRGSRAGVTLMRADDFAGNEQCRRVHCVSRTRNARELLKSSEIVDY